MSKDDVRTDGEAAASGAVGTSDSPKRQGDELTGGTAAEAAVSSTGETGDSPKHQGDKLERAADLAAKR